MREDFRYHLLLTPHIHTHIYTHALTEITHPHSPWCLSFTPTLEMYHPRVLVVLGVVSFSHGIELIENYYKGERYEPKEPSNEHLSYSSSLIASASSSPTGPFLMPQARKMDESEGRELTFSGLMDQLGIAFQEELKGDPASERSRQLGRAEDGKKVGLLWCYYYCYYYCIYYYYYHYYYCYYHYCRYLNTRSK